MEIITRAVFNDLKAKLKPGKVLILLGARRVGKSHLLKQVISDLDPNQLLVLNGEDQTTIDRMSIRSVENFKLLLGNAKFLIIDEAQNVPDIGLKLKLLVDEIPTIHVIVTGSSMFELSNKLGEPLVGRSQVIQLFPFAQLEYQPNENIIKTDGKLENRLIYGSYPELIHLNEIEEKKDYLEELISSYLLKDILS